MPWTNSGTRSGRTSPQIRAACHQIATVNGPAPDDGQPHYKLWVESCTHGPWWVGWDGFEYVWLDGPTPGSALGSVESPGYVESAAQEIARVLEVTR
ncbi:hypothetical protein SMC26_39720 [Actinomadura fulvescens]|uniref:Uncharacterized protein n=1 Tax=Actinomadura fulvescens TaxID=46160 RepID=A0ABN3QKX6_9ACTN